VAGNEFGSERRASRLDYILTNAVRALLDAAGATLLMLPRLLIDNGFRVQLVDQFVCDPANQG